MVRALGPVIGVMLSVCCLAQVQITPRRTAAAKAEPSPGSIRVESTLVQVPVHVTTALGANVPGLTREDFRLWEDGVEQPITHFSMDDVPASIGLVYDCSGSMRGKMQQEAAAAEAFMRTANPEDEFFLVKFGDRATLATHFTSEAAEILRSIERSRPAGRTALMDAVHLAMKEMKIARNSSKALILISDGGDNQSRSNARRIEAELVEADLQLYAIGLYGSAPSRKLTAEEKAGPRLLENLAEMTGGRLFPAPRTENLAEISTRISRELRNEYVLGYLPASNHDGKYHRITVKVRPSNVRIHFRQGYYAPL